MGHTLSIAGIESNLGHARQRHMALMVQLFASASEIAQLESDLRNAKREPGDVRPLEHAGDPNCNHEWNGDPENNQIFCSECPARFDLTFDGTPEELFGAKLGDRFPTFDPDVITSLGDGSSAAGWESVCTGGFEAQQISSSNARAEVAEKAEEGHFV